MELRGARCWARPDGLSFEPMPMTLDCPACGKQISVSRRYAGKKGRCPKCKAEVRIPAAAGRDEEPDPPDETVLAESDATDEESDPKQTPSGMKRIAKGAAIFLLIFTLGGIATTLLGGGVSKEEAARVRERLDHCKDALAKLKERNKGGSAFSKRDMATFNLIRDAGRDLLRMGQAASIIFDAETYSRRELNEARERFRSAYREFATHARGTKKSVYVPPIKSWPPEPLSK
jgi:hypothetical protein